MVWTRMKEWLDWLYWCFQRDMNVESEEMRWLKKKKRKEANDWLQTYTNILWSGQPRSAKEVVGQHIDWDKVPINTKFHQYWLPTCPTLLMEECSHILPLLGPRNYHAGWKSTCCHMFWQPRSRWLWFWLWSRRRWFPPEDPSLCASADKDRFLRIRLTALGSHTIGGCFKPTI